MEFPANAGQLRRNQNELGTCIAALTAEVQVTVVKIHQHELLKESIFEDEKVKGGRTRNT